MIWKTQFFNNTKEQTMIKKDSPSLREFYFKTPTRKGESIAIKYGYDMSAKHSGFYLKASINGGAYSSDSKTLRKVRALKIPSFIKLIDSIGTDVMGAPYDYETTSQHLIEGYLNTEKSREWNGLISLYRIQGDKDQKSLADLIVKYSRSSGKARISLLTRYNNSRRLALIKYSKDAVKGLRELYNDGIEISGKHIVPKYQGYMEKYHVLSHYKRDIDYIRKARVRLYKTLGRKYVPFK
jgi:hypothetical protein